MKATESSQWYTQNNPKGFIKTAATTLKQCGKCDAKGHTSDDCWGKCTYCCKFNHRSERCFFKDAQKKEKVEKANKAQNQKQKKKKAKKATDRSDKQEEVEDSESEYSEKFE